MGTAGKVVIGLVVVGGVVVGVYFLTKQDKTMVKKTTTTSPGDNSKEVLGVIKGGEDLLSKLIGKFGNTSGPAQSTTQMPVDYSGDDNWQPSGGDTAAGQNAADNPLFDPGNFA